MHERQRAAVTTACHLGETGVVAQPLFVDRDEQVLREIRRSAGRGPQSSAYRIDHAITGGGEVCLPVRRPLLVHVAHAALTRDRRGERYDRRKGGQVRDE